MTSTHQPPLLLTAPVEAQRWSDTERARGHRIAFVPTMGALHHGHLALVDEAHRRGDRVVVSIFVNPLQFDVAADFDRYPRPIDDDLAACARAGVHAVYAPTAAAMYPIGFQTHVEPGDLATRYEGTHRPGHFRGVATVVTKLFAAVRPHVAVFGRKDAQQLALIQRLTLDLDLAVEIVPLDTVRDVDGLALSSRNARLVPADRAAAVCIHAGLLAAAQAVAAGERDAATLELAARRPVLDEPRARLEYVDLVEPTTFAHLTGMVDGPSLLVAAVWFGDVRLIDNLPLATGQ